MAMFRRQTWPISRQKQGYFFLCSDISSEDKRKLDDFLLVLEESGVGRIIEDADDREGQAVVRPIIPIVCSRRSSTPSPCIPQPSERQGSITDAMYFPALLPDEHLSFRSSQNRRHLWEQSMGFASMLFCHEKADN